MQQDQDEGTRAGSDFADGFEGAGEGSTRGRIGKAREYVSSKMSDASGSVRDKYERARSKVEEVDVEGATEQIRAYVRSNPGKALLVSIGAGFLIGLLLRRGNDD